MRVRLVGGILIPVRSFCDVRLRFLELFSADGSRPVCGVTYVA